MNINDFKAIFDDNSINLKSSKEATNYVKDSRMTVLGVVA